MAAWGPGHCDGAPLQIWGDGWQLSEMGRQLGMVAASPTLEVSGLARVSAGYHSGGLRSRCAQREGCGEAPQVEGT